MFLKKGMKVKVCVGKDKGKSGEIIEINRARELAKVKEVNMLKKHKKPTKENKGGIITKEGYIHLSNLKKLDESQRKTKGKKWHQDWEKNIKMKLLKV